jgi:hypothetical protein
MTANVPRQGEDAESWHDIAGKALLDSKEEDSIHGRCFHNPGYCTSQCRVGGMNRATTVSNHVWPRSDLATRDANGAHRANMFWLSRGRCDRLVPVSPGDFLPFPLIQTNDVVVASVARSWRERCTQIERLACALMPRVLPASSRRLPSATTVIVRSSILPKGGVIRCGRG